MDSVLAQVSCVCLGFILGTRKKLVNEPLIDVLGALATVNIT